ncbi:MAG: ComEC/Rec2 family competence protein [Bacillota bacterium]
MNKQRKIIGGIIVLLVLIFTIATPVASVEVLGEDEFFNYKSDELIVRYFNLQIENKEEVRKRSDTPIKSGDAILITTPGNKNILIDSGINYTGEQLNTYLNKIGINKLDYAFATHPHWDHIGGYLTIFNTIEIEQLYHANIPNNSGTYSDYLSLLKRNNIPNEYVEAGDQIEVEESLVIDVLNPPAGTGPETLPSGEEISTTQINNESLVLKLSYQDTEFLFIGDLYKEREKELVKEYGDELGDINFLHAGHHGEETSSSFDLIEAVLPEVVVMSRDELASISNYNKFRSYGAEVFVTGLNGHILLKTSGDKIDVMVEEEIDSEYLK